MPLTQERKAALEALCGEFRAELVRLLHSVGSGHPGGSLSVCEILTALYFEKAVLRPEEPGWEGRDRILLTKGHAAPMLYLILAARGFFPKAELATLRKMDSRLQGHPCKDTPGVEMPSGPLGIGLSAALGLALGLRLSGNKDSTVYAVMGDGELNEGTVWEACMSASKFRADNLVVIIDRNSVQLDGTTRDIMPMDNLEARFSAFGFETLACDGHDVSALCDALDWAKAVAGKPAVILAETIKGKGVSFMEGQAAWHGRPINAHELALALEELEGGRHHG